MKVYHRTSHPAEILATGFLGRPDLEHLTGVWFADSPVDRTDGAKGWTVLSIHVPDEVLAIHERDSGGNGFRYFMLPQETANRFGPPTVHDDDWKGFTRAEIEEAIMSRRSTETDFHLREADRIEAHLPFLEKYGLLGKDDE